jgi:hypothetical protein
MGTTLTDYLPAKLGRNDLCLCGSGKKYKKCCLNNQAIERESFLKQKSIHKLKKRNAAIKPIFIDTEKLGVSKMSEIILEYAEELLKPASTSEGMQRAIFLAISAWNLSLISENNRTKAIDMFICDVIKIEKKSKEWEEIQNVVYALIEKRVTDYPEVDRFIFDYEFIQLSKNDFHLNVISSLCID